MWDELQCSVAGLEEAEWLIRVTRTVKEGRMGTAEKLQKVRDSKD